MIMLYAVRMRLVFISSVTAMTPLRTISAITGSSGPRLVRSVALCLVVFRAIPLLPAGAVFVARTEPPGPAGACHRAGQRPDPVGRPDYKLRAIRDQRFSKRRG